MLPILFPLLFPVSCALPTSPSLTAHDAPATESWYIPRLQMHVMSVSTGLPSPGTWPVSAHFNSSIDFDMLVPCFSTGEAAAQTRLVNCKASWRNGTFPDEMVACGTAVVGGGEADKVDDVSQGESEVQFGMTIYEGLGVTRRPEMSFLLIASRRRRAGTLRNAVLQGQVPITANDPTEPSSYLTCLLGAPLDGLRCEIGSYMSVRKELVIEASSL